MSRSKDLLSIIYEEGPGGFSSTINGFSFTASGENGDVVERKIINMVETDNVQGAIQDLTDAIEFLKRHKDKQIDLTEPVL
jgi:hypothetical protein